MKQFIYTAVTILVIFLSRSFAEDTYGQNTSFHFEPLFNLSQNIENHKLLGRISAGAISQDMSYFIMDNGNKQIHQFDLHGEYLRSFGNEGRGPGEFLQVGSITLDNNQSTIYAFDYRNARIVGFDSKNGSYSHTINLLSVAGSPLQKIFAYQNNLMLLGNHRFDHDPMIHQIDLVTGSIEKSIGSFIDFSSFINSPVGKQQLSVVHASKLDNNILVGLAAPNRFKLFDSDWNLKHTFEDNLLPTPWETHMIMESGRYETTFYSMSLNNQLLNNETFLLHWQEVINPDGFITKTHLDLRNLNDGSIIYTETLDGLIILDYMRLSDQVIYLLTRNKSYEIEVYTLTINH